MSGNLNLPKIYKAVSKRLVTNFRNCNIKLPSYNAIQYIARRPLKASPLNHLEI